MTEDFLQLAALGPTAGRGPSRSSGEEAAMDSRIEHEAAVGLARRLVQIVSPCLRPEEQHEAQDHHRQAHDVLLDVGQGPAPRLNCHTRA